MKKFLQFVPAAVVTVALGLAPSVSAAASSCAINTTGPNSFNSCTVNENNSVTINCTNGVQLSNTNRQSAISGTATVTGNTVSGSATTGPAINATTIANDLSQHCAAAPATTPVAATTTQVTPPATPAPAPTAGGRGAGAPQSTAAKVAALPNTGPSTLVTGIAVSAATIGSLAGLAHVALSSYRRRAFKA